ncbi:MAG: CAP domain-containing protein [Robiginitalea sp.]|jgi:uncharacterized protein YkwD
MKLRHVLLAILVVFSISCSKESLETEEILTAQNVTSMEAELLQLVNRHRDAQGQKTLSFSEVAYKYANSHTDYMVKKGALTHDNFGARVSGISKEENAKAVSENVAMGYLSSEMTLEAWLSSESHRKTMEGNFSHTAISVKKDSEGTLYFTQLFYLK